jgi:hypothetical protein
VGKCGATAYDGIIAASQHFWSMGLGWQEFQDVTFRMVALDPTEALHSVIVRFGEGFVNLCSISVEYSKQEPPVTWGALEYSYGTGNIQQSEDTA